jgi:phosphatidylglycerophosphate synthase
MIRKAVIVVGPPPQHVRLRKGMTLPLVGGLTLPERLAYQLAKEGVQQILLVGIDRALSIVSRLPGPDVSLTALGRVPLAEALVGCGEEAVLLLRADRLYDQSLLTRACRALPPNRGVIATTGTAPSGADIVPVGLAVACAPDAAWLAARMMCEDTAPGEAAGVPAAVDRLIAFARTRGLLGFDPQPDSGWWHPAASKTQLRSAERVLFHSLGKPTDGRISRRFNRPVSQAISRLICNTRWTPNQISVPVFLVGMLSAALWFTDIAVWIALGGLLFHLASVLDGVDGEIARVRFQHSKLGAVLDSILDHIVMLAFVGGAAWHIYRTGGPLAYPLLFGLVLALAALGSAIVNYDQVTKTSTGKPTDLSWEFERPAQRQRLVSRIIQVLRPWIGRDVDAVVLGACAIVGLDEGIPLLAITATAIYFAVVVGNLIVTLRRRRPAAGWEEVEELRRSGVEESRG